ncbi:uncharacterized protein LOC124205601 [Daphnia pulex]|uniref:uncharacterized protein LOC124205601 n=1 Tax=Daphnia pulex TaxID=6669 RepID=UPI001EE0A084|nr:uncharacterized protein LOC124205601 [Daphnia pulex]
MMAREIEIFLSLTLICTTIWACKDGQVDQLTARQGLDGLLNENSYPTNSWVFPYYYNIQPQVPFAGYANSYEGRIPFNRKPPGYFANVNADYYNSQEGRLGFGNLGANLFNTGLLSNLFTPLTPLANLINRVVEACTSPSGEAGVCSTASACSSISGRPSGSCTQGRVCCVNVVNACGNNATRNNTYWQSPFTSVSSPCSLTVHLDNKLAQQASPICQIRLDFVSFTTAPPTDGTCTDTFTVEGATTVAPTICGVNSGQHMYLDVPSSATTPTDVKLIFKFATGTAAPTWNIKIAMLPCGATYLAPADCLQYFTSATGRVKSFNWQDSAAARQLNNQNYNICFRTELVSGSRATQMCVSVCTEVTSGDAFSITTPPQSAFDLAAPTAGAAAFAATLSSIGTTFFDASVPPSARVSVATCLYDYLLINGGRDANNVEADRYCGNALNPVALGTPATAAAALALATPLTLTKQTPGGLATSTQVCTPVKPFKMTYHTDGQETVVVAATNTIGALADTANTGFCLDYQEK